MKLAEEEVEKGLIIRLSRWGEIGGRMSWCLREQKELEKVWNDEINCWEKYGEKITAKLNKNGNCRAAGIWLNNEKSDKESQDLRDIRQEKTRLDKDTKNRKGDRIVQEEDKTGQERAKTGQEGEKTGQEGEKAG